ncbi:MAG: hypothetical protein COW84_07355 [Gammaproteobacteria bacterium CG22_combo_CG10-13_8_21_14_all_40_8]|nr:MAG: hypothetical protein COW84_07355 [Gammaproteobacteria bacterium CG22_combo_CG10-13_8_21_14_all_40_8]
MNSPKFAVVGHPNKGKSSIVATLSHNDSIEISKRSGTTQQAQCFEIKTTHSSYELFDTPGFQRPSKVLAWLKNQAKSADKRSQAVQKFVDDASCQQLFPDEIELLKPLTAGAAILYVVDGSRPFGIEYEAEMEILQWTGAPSMALINPIENSQYVEEWERVLVQYFRTVRVFNPMEADFHKQMDLLNVFAHLQPQWAQKLKLVTQDLELKRLEQSQQCSIILARLLEDLCHHKTTQKVLSKAQANLVEPLLKNQYLKWMVNREQKAIQEMLTLYSHYHTQIHIEDMSLPHDLFDCEQWYLWGLTKNQLMTSAAITGAAAGSAIDLALAGTSLMLGAVGGGMVGLASAWLGANKLVDMRLQGLPIGGYDASFGPISHQNFPYVVIGRFLTLYQKISTRNHALREILDINPIDLKEKINQLEVSEQKKLHLSCDKLSHQKPVEDLNKILLQILN